MTTRNDLFEQFSKTDPKLIQQWQRRANAEIKRFANSVASSSPFLDKPNKRMFGVRNNKDGESLTVYGTSPNAGRTRPFHAPTNEWESVQESFRFFGKDGWRTIHKVQKVTNSIGISTQTVSYYGIPTMPKRFFGIKKGKVTLAYGKTENSKAVPVYARDSFADWLFDTYSDEIGELILQAGQAVLTDYLIDGGQK